MDIVEIEKIFKSENRQKIEMMARNILVHGRTHKYMQELSQHSERFNYLLSTTAPEDKKYLSLVYILAEHLNEINRGACPCSIVEKPMFNSPDRLQGIMKIMDKKINYAEYSIWVHSKCLSCRKEYESKMVESGFGQKVIWNECS
jgi:hypothetical protein